ncbi:hypothetical protein ACIGJO_27150 [Streptomyces sp. NPDC079020]|uniref:hypothetical protein n=1 Tax=Streptomyces sp. NPDC079020 TaxID=3365722 RepID=UPI0037D59831
MHGRGPDRNTLPTAPGWMIIVETGHEAIPTGRREDEHTRMGHRPPGTRHPAPGTRHPAPGTNS